MGVIRRTKSVETILSAFGRSKGALSVIDLVDRFSSEMNKTTVYRILDRLEDDGSLHSFMGKGGLKWYAVCDGCSRSNHHDAHPHFQCSVCGKTECLSIDVAIPNVPNHRVLSAELLLTGLCADCSS